jgi:hypothetical protein
MQIFLDLARSLVGETQVPKVPGLIVRGRGTRIMAEAKGQIAVISRIVAVAGLRHKDERFLETSLMKAFQAKDSQSD